MALTISGARRRKTSEVVSGSYTGAGGTLNTTLPIGFIPSRLVIGNAAGDTWEWGYGLGWYTMHRPTAGGQVVNAQCIFQYLGKELDDNPGETGDDYAEPYITDDDEAGVVIANVTDQTYSPNVDGTVYVFWAIS